MLPLLWLVSLLLPHAKGETSLKVVGGVSSDVRKYPFYVALVPTGITSGSLDVLCGSSLITQNHLLTAAHCYNGVPATQRPQLFTAAFILENRCQGKYGRLVRNSQVRLHPNYSIRTMKNDIAVITLAESVSFTPVQLPPARPRMRGPATVIGYGNTKRKAGTYPCTLQEAEVQLFSRQECLRTGNFIDIANLPNVFCAGRLSGGVDTCDGDSGGPLIRRNSDGRTFILGITSFGTGCARPGYPGVYTDVSKYLKWVRQQTGQAAPTESRSPNIFCQRNLQEIIQFLNLCMNSPNRSICDCDY